MRTSHALPWARRFSRSCAAYKSVGTCCRKFPRPPAPWGGLRQGVVLQRTVHGQRGSELRGSRQTVWKSPEACPSAFCTYGGSMTSTSRISLEQYYFTVQSSSLKRSSSEFRAKFTQILVATQANWRITRTKITSRKIGQASPKSQADT